MEIIEAVGGLWQRSWCLGCLFQLALLVLGILKAYILQGTDLLLTPALQDLVCIWEAGLSGLKNRAGTGLLDQVHGKAVLFGPGVDQGNLCVGRIAVGNSHGFENGEIFFAVAGGGILGHFYGCDSLLLPCHGYGLNITDAAVIPSHTVLDQIINKIHRHMQLIIEKQDLAGLRRGKGLAQILLRNVKQLDNIFVLLQLLHPVRGKMPALGKGLGRSG